MCKQVKVELSMHSFPLFLGRGSQFGISGILNLQIPGVHIKSTDNTQELPGGSIRVDV